MRTIKDEMATLKRGQPAQQEPVATVPREWRNALRRLTFLVRTSRLANNDLGLIEAIEKAEQLLSRPYLYTSPQPAQRKPLTNLEGLKLAYNHHWLNSLTLRDAYILGIRDAEAAHGIRGQT